MNIYEKIDVMFSGNAEDKPKWADEILGELKEIKQLLEEQRNSKNTNKPSQNFYNFIKEFRISMRADTIQNIYPTFVYNNRMLGVDFKGLLYDKSTSRHLSKDEAYTVYRYAYDQQNYNKYSA